MFLVFLKWENIPETAGHLGECYRPAQCLKRRGLTICCHYYIDDSDRWFRFGIWTGPAHCRNDLVLSLSFHDFAHSYMCAGFDLDCGVGAGRLLS